MKNAYFLYFFFTYLYGLTKLNEFFLTSNKKIKKNIYAFDS